MLILIFVSVLVSTLVGTHASSRLAASREPGPEPLGARVVVGVGDPDQATGALSIAVRVARADGGVVHPVLVIPHSAPAMPKAARQRLLHAAAAAGIDGMISTVLDSSVLHGALQAGLATEATLVLVAETAESDPAEYADIYRADGHGRGQLPPLAVVRGDSPRLGVVRTMPGGGGSGGDEDEDGDGDHDGEGGSLGLVRELARRVAGGPAKELQDGEEDFSELLAPGDVTFLSLTHGGDVPSSARDLPGLVITTLAD